MPEKDAVTKEYMSDPAIFADAFNFYLYGGRTVIVPEMLHEKDTSEIALPFGKDGDSAVIQKYRDILKSVTIMEDINATYMILGIENQSQMHYAMPVRNMLYDALQYASQVTEIAEAHRKDGERADTSAEFLSGFYNSDRLLPVITLTVYWGADEWAAPKDLHGMLQAPPEILQAVDNYRLHLIDPTTIRDEDFVKFHTELAAALKYVKYSKDRKMLDTVLHEDAVYHDLSRQTANLVNIVTGSNLKIPEGEERVDMCEAITQMVNEARDEATLANAVTIAKKMLEDGGFTFEKIATLTGLPLEKVQELASEKTA